MRYQFSLFLLICFASSLTLVSCGDDMDDSLPCSGPEVAGLSVLVTDAVSGEVLTFGVTVNVTEGAFSTDLIESSGHFVGLYDQEGGFTLTVTKSGYQTYIEDNVPVFKPGCHSLTTNRAVALQPL
jgi:hypothetical protein